jgi:hypothetical protein
MSCFVAACLVCRVSEKVALRGAKPRWGPLDARKETPKRISGQDGAVQLARLRIKLPVVEGLEAGQGLPWASIV